MPASFYLGLLLLGVYAAHVYDKRKNNIVPELLWACNVNNLISAIGLIFNVYWLIVIGFMFQVGIGIPAYIFEVLGKKKAYEREIFMHVAPALFGYVALKDVGLPEHTVLVTFLSMVILLFVVSFYGTSPVHNVNVIHEPWELCKKYFTGRMKIYRVFNAVTCLLFLLAAELLCRDWLFTSPRR